MYFQVVDEKCKCFSFYIDDKIYKNEIPSSLLIDKKNNKTWKYYNYINNICDEYAYLYCGGKSFSEIVPEHYNKEWIQIKKKLYSFFKSYKIVKININEYCIYDIIPENVLIEYFEIKNNIIKYIFENYKKPFNYEYLLELLKLITKIEQQKLNLDKQNLIICGEKYRKEYIKYNIFGTLTGRLKTKSDSFPILNLNKRYRKILNPNNDYFLEIDYNAAELRVLLGLSNIEQPEIDIHKWSQKYIFNNIMNREECKKTLFGWLYNLGEKDEKLEKFYKRNYVIDNFWKNGKIVTPYGKEIKCDRFHALNYLLQSTLAELVLRKSIEINKLLINSNSYISFIIHDSIIFDFSLKDEELIKKIVNIFKSTEFGNFLINMKKGKNFGEMKKCVLL